MRSLFQETPALLQFSWLIQKDGFCVVEGEQRLNIALGLVLLEKAADFFGTHCRHFAPHPYSVLTTFGAILFGTGVISSRTRLLNRITSLEKLDWSRMDVHLIDGTYELFRHFFAVPASADVNGQEVGAVRGVLNSVFSMIQQGATHVGVATDHVVESFRNDLYPGYKTSEGVAPELLSQFPILEEALEAMGVMVWPMVEFEADDALASAAAKAAKDDRVNQVLICTPDKDLSQCVVGKRVVQLDRRRDILRDEAGVEAKFGVKPQSIPDYLAVVGDSADGFPGMRGWGVKAATLTFSQYLHLEDIPKDWREWHPSIKKARVLSESLFSGWDDALLFRTLATLRVDVPVFETVEDLRWKGPRPNFEEHCKRMKVPNLLSRVPDLQPRH